jgi:hypothetical protein
VSYTSSSASKFQKYNESYLKIGMDRDMIGGALLYHLRRKKNDEYGDQSDKDTLISTQLLVIWGGNTNEYISDVFIIEHESAFIWNEQKLEKLCHAYNSHYYSYVKLDTKYWLLDGNTKLETWCESSHGGFEMTIIISEAKCLNCPEKPLFIDPNR